MNDFSNLLSPLSLGDLELPNRLIMGSMHTGMEELPGGETGMARFYARRAGGGVGLMVTGGFSPNLDGRLTPGDGGVLDGSRNMEFHKKVTDAVRKEGGIIFLQILHTGRYGFHPDIVSASARRAPINPFTPREMSPDEILTTVEDYAKCAHAAEFAGYHGVEIMGSEGYLITQFLAKRTNRRTDEWGGCFKNRSRFALEIVKAVRRSTGPGFPIMFRISLLDLVEEGCTWNEVVELAQGLESAGVNILDTGIGWHESRVPTIAAVVPECAFVWVTGRLKKEVGIPVVAAVRINRPESAEKILSSGNADLVSLARPLLADPDFVKKAAGGEADRIVPCIACNQACLDNVFIGMPASCLVNPAACREKELEIRPAERKKKIAVVGGGPAGLFFALSARKRGHYVTIFEKSFALGGQLNLAERIPGKEEFSNLKAFLEAELERLQVEVLFEWSGDLKDLEDEGFDTIVLATGVKPSIPSIPGVENPKVCTYEDILSGNVEPGGKVVILGGGGVGVDTAVFLTSSPHPGGGKSVDTGGPGEPANLQRFFSEWGVDMEYNHPGGLLPPEKRCIPKSPRDVVLLKRSRGKPGKGLGKTTVWIHRAALENRGLKVMDGVTYKKIDDQGVHVVTSDGDEVCVAADTVVLCTGQESNACFETGTERDVEIHSIGGLKSTDALDAKRAIEEAVELAAKI